MEYGTKDGVVIKSMVGIMTTSECVVVKLFWMREEKFKLSERGEGQNMYLLSDEEAGTTL